MRAGSRAAETESRGAFGPGTGRTGEAEEMSAGLLRGAAFGTCAAALALGGARLASPGAGSARPVADAPAATSAPAPKPPAPPPAPVRLVAVGDLMLGTNVKQVIL